MKAIKNFFADESGATAVEYVAVTGLAAAGILAFFSDGGLGMIIAPGGAANQVGTAIDTVISGM